MGIVTKRLKKYEPYIKVLMYGDKFLKGWHRTRKQRERKALLSSKGELRFVPRIPELRLLEGWFPMMGVNTWSGLFSYPFSYFPKREIRLSCKFNDLLRSVDSKHFPHSCFRPNGGHYAQILKRLRDPNWGVVMLLDRAGTVQSRAFVSYGGINAETLKPVLFLSPVQGTGLSQETIVNSLHHVCEIRTLEHDTYM